MKKYLLITAVMTTASFAFFNIPQEMMGMGSQMMFPVQPQPPVCNCKCDK